MCKCKHLMVVFVGTHIARTTPLVLKAVEVANYILFQFFTMSLAMPLCLSLYSPVMLLMLPFHFSAILSINLPVCFTIHFVIDIVNGGWNSWQAWGAWSTCDRACGRGRRVRYGVRECNNPTPKNGGVPCPGSHFRKNSGSSLLKHCPGTYSNKQFLSCSSVRYNCQSADPLFRLLVFYYHSSSLTNLSLTSSKWSMGLLAGLGSVVIL